MTQTMTAETVAALALMALQSDTVPSEEGIRATVLKLCTTFGLTDEVREAAIRIVLSRRLVTIAPGYSLQEDHVPWLAPRRATIEPYYWRRYEIMLGSRLAPQVLGTLDRSTDDILDLAGNPGDLGAWRRRGLVLGDVQSGKTAAYAGLICKAADAGYKLIVLLTGTIENLRQQTQERLDEGFCGLDSSAYLTTQKARRLVGVGAIDSRRFPVVFTSSASDFKSQTLDTLGLGLAALNEPALVVVKKHARILANLEQWLRRHNLGGAKDLIDLPLLLIDDEADNASVNTNDKDQDPTRINQCIRALLRLFRRSTYVGFTATPFANIFIDPDTPDEELIGHDLFPRDFIYTLQSPSDYFGPSTIFDGGANAKRYLRETLGIETTLPSSHKSTFLPVALPESLIEAMYCFVISNAIRDLRGEGPTHRSMLVNVSPYTAVQEQVNLLLHEELRKLQESVLNFAALPAQDALRDTRLRRAHDLWVREYSNAGYDWAEVQGALREAALPISTRTVNQRTGPGALEYRAHKDVGLRVIAVGGNSLSRGLTLEGLCISYFRRTTKMYDTLLQMGRWFGYRLGYQDLCRVWLPEESTDWYGHISDAVEELRLTLLQMRRAGRAPKDFGLAVRAHPESLLITARNKMRTGTTVSRLISLSLQGFESVELSPAAADIETNHRAAHSLLRSALAGGAKMEKSGTAALVRGVPRKLIAAFLRSFKMVAREVRFQPGPIADLLEETPDPALDSWDVGIPSGTGDEVVFDSLRVYAQKRTIRPEGSPLVLAISGEKRRVGSRGVEALGLTRDEQDKALDEALEDAISALKPGATPPTRDKVNVSDRHYRAQRERPLCLLHAVQPQSDGLPPLPALPLMAVGLSFPKLRGEAREGRVKYVVTTTKLKELYGMPDDESDDYSAVEAS
jgi:hypothetical protein